MGYLYHGYVSHNQRVQFTDLKIFGAMPSAVAARDPSWNCLHMRIGASHSNGWSWKDGEGLGNGTT
jgi:hypothetical protein